MRKILTVALIIVVASILILAAYAAGTSAGGEWHQELPVVYRNAYPGPAWTPTARPPYPAPYPAKD